MRHVFTISLASLPVAALAACASAPPAETCIVAPLDAQPTTRFPSGRTYYLPTLSLEGGCGSLAWSLLEAPPANTNVVVREAGQSRFTPVETGRYVFAAGEARRSLEVIDGRGVPYEDFSYYPSRSQVSVGDEIWITNALVPTVTRVSASEGARLGEIVVGPWPVAIAHHEGARYAVVAQRASDTIGLLDVESARIVDAIHVGDEPSNLVLSPDGARAYVTLATEDAVAVVDLEARRLEATIPAVVDPLGLALSRDGARLFVASHRSGQAQRFPFEDDPASEERDLVVIDTATRAVSATWLEVGSTIGALALSDDDTTLYVATLRNDTESPLGTADNAAFQHVLAAYDTATGSERVQADLSRQPTSAGPAVTLHQPALAGGLVWVPAESSDLVVGLDPVSLEERQRVSVPGRPRHALARGETLFVHGVQALSVTRVTAGGEVLGTTPLADDPRPEDVARGQRYFTGAGRDFAQTWSCNSCHADARGDTLVWNAGPLEGHALSRPFFWLEGTAPLGWAGYLSSVRNYAYTVNINVGVRPTTEEALDLTAYLSGLLPPPAGGATTHLDGSLSEAARRGREVFETRGGCVGCHAGELSTNRSSFPSGITSGVSDVPSLVGAYRHNTWMKRGEARTLEAALDLVLASTSVTLPEGDRSDLLVYLRELQARDFFVLASSPENNQTRVAVDAPIRLSFSAPVWDAAASVGAITLHDAMGAEVAADVVVEADGRHVRVEPRTPLGFAARYEVRLGEGLESFDARALVGARTIGFSTARAPNVRLEGRYVWTVDLPALDFMNRRFDPSVTTPVPVDVQASPTPSGARVTLDYGRSLTLEAQFVIDGDRLVVPPLPVPIGPSFADTRGTIIDLVDDGGEGRAEFGEGAVSMTGPGFVVDDVAFRLEHESSLAGCPEGASGAVAITLGTDDMGRTTFSWDTAEHGDALGLYVTAPRARIPAGPGQVVMGAAYWVVATEAFPRGFASPVTYGVVPMGARDDGATHMASFEELAPGGCYKAAVATTRFRTGEVVFRVPE
ncbi:MAG: Ig-like domain-containing protein [Deltaproteobacteria bacterium]|jgi:YVTN family beta-propeller protein